MIVYFTDRQLNILGMASTELPDGLTIIDDKKVEDVESGVAVFECTVPFNSSNRAYVEECMAVGNYVLRNHEDEEEFYTIIDMEVDTKNQEVYIYAEDAGLDLLNEVVGKYESTRAQPISYYINMFAKDSGFEIGVNEVAKLTRELSWDDESTVTERLASVAAQFDGCEISYSFKIEGLKITKKYINIYKERGHDNGVQLRLNKDIDRIVTKKSVANLATALEVTGGTPEPEEEEGEETEDTESTEEEEEEKPEPITLRGYRYDDGNFYVSGTRLCSREALKKWSRYNWVDEPNQLTHGKGHIVKTFSYDTIDQRELCNRAITELKKISEIEVNYEVDVNFLPEGSKIGDRITIVDDEGELYVSGRILKMETSAVKQSKEITLGEYLISESGISKKIEALASQFAKTSSLAHRAWHYVHKANNSANEAQNAISELSVNIAAAAAAQTLAEESATEAQEVVTHMREAVLDIEEQVETLQTTVNNARTAADNAQVAAETAQTKADEATEAAANALAEAADAKEASVLAQSAAISATQKAETAQSTAEMAKADAQTAQATAEAAKLDAAKAKEDIDALGEELDTVTTTMEADYARKTELTEAAASLQSQISQNAAEISSTVSRMEMIDETANNAQEQAQAAQNVANTAKEQADQALADAIAAQNIADEATAAATAAQNEADIAKAAAEAAQSVADKAEADLEAAKADLATVTSRIDATEEEIAAAQQAVTAAQTAADKAKTDSAEAVTKAAEAQSKADTASTKANDALSAANLAVSVAEQAQTSVDEAVAMAAEAQRTANSAATQATELQTRANEIAQAAANAQAKADDAKEQADQAAADLATAQQNLANVTSRVGATEADVEAAQAAVITAKAAADKAQEEAEAAQATADTAKANAATAQAAANNAKTAADNAQTAADEAQQAADEAQAAVNALAVRVTTAETKITQNTEQIALMAKKTEVVEMLGGYSTKEETEAAILLESDSIISEVSSTYATSERVTTAESLIQQLSNCIEMLVTDENGESLMTQTENGWTFSMKETSEAVSGLSDLLETLQQESGSTKAAVDVLRQAVSDHGNTLEYVNVKTYEGEPCIELGESDSNFKLMITNTRIMFMNGANVPTYINTNGVVTQNIEVKGEIVQGGYVMLNTADGGWGLLWKGVGS
jgi:phage minor structural protein